MLTIGMPDQRQTGLTAKRLPIVSGPAFSIDAMELGWQGHSQLTVHYPSMQLHYLVMRDAMVARWSLRGHAYEQDGVVLVPPDSLVEAPPPGVAERHSVIAFTPDEDWLSEIAGGGIDWGRIDVSDVVRYRNVHIDRAMRRLLGTVRRPSKRDKEFQSALCAMIGVDIVRGLGAVRSNQLRTGRLTARETQIVNEMLWQDGEPMPSIRQIADELGTSAGHLRRLFKESTGLSLHEHMHDIKMKRAVGLLCDQANGLKQIAYWLGYAHHSAFSVAFRQHFGCPPNNYRKQMAN